MTPRSILLVAMLLATAGAASARADDAPAPPSEPGAESVVARVGDTPIFRAELDAALRRLGHARLRSPEQRLRLEAEPLEQLVDERLLRREIEREQIAVNEDDVTEVVNRMRGQLAERKIPFDAFLAQSGRDEPSLRSQIRLEIGLNKLLVPRLNEEALAAAFEKHRRDIDGTVLRASHIILRPDPARGDQAFEEMRRKADAIRREILTGAITFADAAKKYSAGPSRRQGGDIGFFPRQGMLDESFARAAFALAKGDLSKPFVTPFGVHLVLVTDIQPGLGRLDALRPQLEKLLVQQAIREIAARGRQTTPITFTPGIVHFAAGPEDGNGPGPRRIVVAEGKDETAPQAE
jgi:peptidyl-prolyl cis-trans isomerase C